MEPFDPKRPTETVTLTFDFTLDLPSPRSVQNFSVSIEGLNAYAMDASAVLDGQPAIQGNYILQRVKGGTAGGKYALVATIIRDDDEVRDLSSTISVVRWN